MEGKRLEMWSNEEMDDGCCAGEGALVTETGKRGRKREKEECTRDCTRKTPKAIN